MRDGSATEAPPRRAVIGHDAVAIAAALRIAAQGRMTAGAPTEAFDGVSAGPSRGAPLAVAVLSAPGGGAWPGPGVFRAMVEAAAASAGVAPEEVMRHAVLDCADLPGAALAALRAGWRRIVLWPDAQGFAAVAAAAAEIQAEVLTRAPPALDLGPIDLRRPGGQRLVARWLERGERPGHDAADSSAGA